MAFKDYVTSATNKITIGRVGIGLIITAMTYASYVRPALRVQDPSGNPLWEVSDHGAIGLSGVFGSLGDCVKSGGSSGSVMTFGPCSSGGGFGSGNVLTIGDNRYVLTQGDTMTGALVIQNGNTHTPSSPLLLNVRGTMSGQYLTVNMGRTRTGTGIVIRQTQGNSGAFLDFRNAAGEKKLSIDPGGYIRGHTGVVITSRPNMGNFGGDYVVTFKRDGTNNFGNGTIIDLQDNAAHAYIKLMTNTFSQNFPDLEFWAPNGCKAMTLPYAGGMYIYNCFQNTPDISLLRAPSQTLYPGGTSPAGWPFQSTFKFDNMTYAGTSSLRVQRGTQLYINGGPIVGINMTMDQSVGMWLDTYNTYSKGLVIRAAQGQRANLMEMTTTGGTLLAKFGSGGELVIGGTGSKVGLKAEIYGTLSGATLRGTTLSGNVVRAQFLSPRNIGTIAVASGSTVATGSGKTFIPVPTSMSGYYLSGAEATVMVAGATNSTTIQIRNANKANCKMLSTPITIPSGSTGDNSTAVVNSSCREVGAMHRLLVDIPDVSTTAPKVLSVVLTFYKP